MITQEQIRESLNEVIVPGVMRSVCKLNLIRDIGINNGNIEVTLASAALDQTSHAWITKRVKENLRKLPETKGINVTFEEANPKDISSVKNIVAVMSGKGGVGKSLVTSLLAISLRRRGYEVGILDGDITGPSIPRMFGINQRPTGSETGIMPATSTSGIGIMSINLLLPNEDDAVIWRGPLIGKTITQFWEDVLWGQLDYLFVDLPPGTADAPLTVMQSLPVTGVVIAFTPQELAAMVVRKAVQMTRQMKTPIIGVVENMSYFTLPDSGKQIELFGKSKARQMADSAQAPLLAQFPIDPQLAQLCDDGYIERYYSEVLDNLADSFLQSISSRTQSNASTSCCATNGSCGSAGDCRDAGNCGTNCN